MSSRLAPFVSSFILAFGLACRQARAAQLVLPPDIPFPADIIKHGGIRLTVRFDSGEEVPVLFSTCATRVFLDKSAESSLGKRLRGVRVHEPEFGWSTASLFAKTNFYLGGTALKLESETRSYNGLLTLDMRRDPAYQAGARGYLGMDCLKHYCVQVDFAAHVIRFLDPDHFDKSELGVVVPLSIPWTLPHVWAEDGVLGKRTERTLIDTVFMGAAVLNRKVFKQALEEGQVEFIRGASKGKDHVYMIGSLTNAVFAGERYQDLLVTEGTDENVLGLAFLVRHLVTFDFPHHTMYLKRLPGRGRRETPPPGQAVIISP